VTVSQPDASTLLVKSTADEANAVDLLAGPGSIIVSDAVADPVDGASICDDTGTTVTCGATGITTVRAELGPGDDTFTTGLAGIRHELHGEGGDDDLAGGDDGDLLVGGSGTDVLRAGGGADRIQARDGEDDGIDCGTGDDDAVTDLEPVGTDCEAVAPVLRGTLGFHPSPQRAYTPLMIGTSGFSMYVGAGAPHPTHVDEISWYRCSADGATCTMVAAGADASIFLTDADVGSRYFVEWHSRNRAGGDTLTSGLTGVILPGTPPGRTPFDPMPTPPMLPYFPPVPPEFAQSIGNAIRYGSTVALGGTDLRRLAKAKTLRFGFVAHAEGTYRFRLTLGAKAARKLGVRGGKRVTVASGTLAVKRSSETVTAALATTKTGRALMRKARRLDLELSSEVTPKWLGTTYKLASPLTLRRR
jgi:hypothetical protein